MPQQNQRRRAGKPSIAFHMIRHAESNNNKVYCDAKDLFRFGSSNFDKDGFQQYVDTHRRADPQLSPLGMQQADALAHGYLNAALFEYQASSPVRILCSPMLRALLTIRPTLERLITSTSRNDNGSATSKHFQQKVHLIIVSFYHEIEGCHTKGRAGPGMNRNEIQDCLFKHILEDDRLQISNSDIDEIVTVDFVGFDHPSDGWYTNGKGPESRIDGEARAAKYCLWLSDYLDSLMYNENVTENYSHDDVMIDDLFDVGFLFPGEDLEDENNKFSKRMRRRRTVLAIGHGDFMSVVLKRLVGGYVGCGRGGRLVEQTGLPHRTAFAHYNTGITELEYFGYSRFIVMTTNITPHIPLDRYRQLRSGGTLRDGWAFTVPPVPDITVETEVVGNKGDNDEDDVLLHDHIQEQIVALKSLYLLSSLLDDEKINAGDESTMKVGNFLRFVVKRGFQVLAVATFSEQNGVLTDVAIRSAENIGNALLHAVKQHAVALDPPQMTLAVRPRTFEDKELFQRMGFIEPQVDHKGKDRFRSMMTHAL